MSDEFLSVSELNIFIRDVINSGFPQALWVCGEIQGYDRSRDKKHVFFELCEKDKQTNEIIARTSLVIFANTRPKIEALLHKSENAFQLKDDIEVKFLCKVDFYPTHGQVRLIVESIDPVYTLGKIAQDRQRLIALLKARGVLDKNKHLPLARVPLHVGLITSVDSAAYHDFIDELKLSRYAFKVKVVNTLMQGMNAQASVVRGIEIFNQADDLDVIVVTRGGGSIAELSCFDSEKIAMAVATARWPVLSGIGHEINTTVTDLAAHTFAKTPTAVARFLVGRVEEFLGHLDERQQQLVQAAGQVVDRQRGQLKDWAVTLQTGTVQLVNAQQHRLARLAEALKRTPAVLIKESRRSLQVYGDGLKRNIHLRLQNARVKINTYLKLVELASPIKTLKRGFSITRSADGAIIRHLKQASTLKKMTTQLIDGIIISEVKELRETA